MSVGPASTGPDTPGTARGYPEPKLDRGEPQWPRPVNTG